jgi:molybdopterin-guanine dinucleotide biosynthesis protein A
VAKGLLEVGGQRILDRLIAAFHAALGVMPLLVANAPDAGSWRPGLRVVADRVPGAGTLGGLLTAVLEAPAPVVCAAWDMPFVPGGLIRDLADGLADADACLPSSAGRRGMEPLCAAYGPACAAPMAEAIKQGDLRAIGFHPAVRVRVLSEIEVRRHGAPELLFFNVNTVEELARANRMIS